MSKDRLLSFEEFFERDIKGFRRYNNFNGYWEEGMIGEVYRKLPHALRFQKEYPDLDKNLFEKTEKRKFFSNKEKKEYEKLLYDSYKIMKNYGISNKDLFA